MYQANDLKKMLVSDLKEIATKLGVQNPAAFKKEDLIIMYSILHKDFSLISINEQLFNAGCKLIR